MRVRAGTLGTRREKFLLTELGLDPIRRKDFSMRLKSFGIVPAAKTLAAFYAVMGLIGGFIFALMTLFGAGLLGEDAGFLGVIFGVGAIFFLPVFYGVCGLIVGSLGAALYNLIAGWVGGFEVELE